MRGLALYDQGTILSFDLTCQLINTWINKGTAKHHSSFSFCWYLVPMRLLENDQTYQSQHVKGWNTKMFYLEKL